MAYELVVGLLLFLLALVVGLLSYYGDVATAPWYTHPVAIVSWWFPFAVIVMMPLDLTSTQYRRCLLSKGPEAAECDIPNALVSEEFLLQFWATLYWTMFNITWWVVPLLISYVRSGEFEFLPRLRAAIKENIIFYGVLGGIGVLLFAYMLLALSLSPDNVLAMAMAAANAYGLLLCIGLLGYGLTTVPWEIWEAADVPAKLVRAQQQVSEMKDRLMDAESEEYAVARQIAAAGRKLDPADPLRKYLQLLTEKCPLALQERTPPARSSGASKASRAGAGAGAAEEEEGVPAEITRAYLVNLHYRVDLAAQTHRRYQAEYSFLLARAFWYKDIVNCMGARDFKLTSTLLQPWEEALPPTTHATLHHSLWAYHVWIKPLALRALALVCLGASLALAWSETTFQVQHPTLSIPALVLQSPNISYGTLQFVSLLFMLYMAVCVFSSLFKVNVFGFYFMVPEHNTDPGSLLFVGSYLCRLMFPLCYNFLNMVSDPIEIVRHPANVTGKSPGGWAGNGKVLTEATTSTIFAPSSTSATARPTGSIIPAAGGNATTNTTTTSVLGDSYNSVFVKYQGKAAELTPLFGDHYDEWLPVLVLLVCILTLINRQVALFGLCGVKGGRVGRREREERAAAVEEGKTLLAAARAAEDKRRKEGGGSALGARDVVATSRIGGGGAAASGTSSTVGNAAVAVAGAAPPRAFAKNTKDLLSRYNATRSEGPAPSVSGLGGGGKISTLSGRTSAPPPADSSSFEPVSLEGGSGGGAAAAAPGAASGSSWFAGFQARPTAPTSASAKQKPTRKGGFQRLGWDEGDGASNM